MYDMYPWNDRSEADTAKPETAINAVQIALDRRDNGGEATSEVATAGPPTAGIPAAGIPAAGTPTAGPTRQ